jgi:hypothetical protein
MENRTVIGVFQPSIDIAPLIRDLIDRGFSKADILILDGTKSLEDRSETRDQQELTTLFLDRGVPDPEAGYFAESVRKGEHVVSVRAGSSESASEAEAVLNRHGALEIEERATEPATSRASEEAENIASAMSAKTLDRSRQGEHQTGRIRGSRVFVW